EEAKILLRQFRSVSINNRLSNAPLHFLGLTPEHRSLICHTHRLQMHVRIEARRIGPLEFFEERLLIAAAPDIITDVIGVFERQYHHVMPASVTECARAGGLGFFVLGLAMYDRSDGFAGVLAHTFPDAHHVAASRIDNLAAAVLDLLLYRQFRAESRHDYHIFRTQIRDVGLLVFAGKISNA